MMDENQVNALIDKALQKDQYSVPKAPYHLHNNIDSPNVPFRNVSNAPNFFCVSKVTNGSTAVRVFGTSALPYNITITGYFLVANDATAGNICLLSNGATVATIAKGTTAGAMIGATSVSNTSLSAGQYLTAVSSSAGNATIFVTFIV